MDISDNRIRINTVESSLNASIDNSFTYVISKQIIYIKADSERKTNDTSFNIETCDFTGNNIK